MPNRGKPSGACQNCKDRHTKCDETRPSCQRCLKTNRICPGYVEGLDLVLRDQNESAKARAKRSQRSRDSIATAAVQKYDNRRKFRASLPSEGGTSLSPHTGLLPSENDLSVCLFVDMWVLPQRDGGTTTGIVEMIPAIHASTSPSSPFSLALAAVAFTTFDKFVKGQKDTESLRATRSLAAAMNATRRALEDPKESVKDETVMAVCLLGLQEACVASFEAGVSTTRHFDGAAALIERRKQDITSPFAQRMLLGLRHEIVYRAMIYGFPLDTSFPLFRLCETLPQNPSSALDEMCISVANIQAKFHSPSSKLKTMSAAILAEAQQIERLLLTWPSLLPLHWLPIKLPIKELSIEIQEAGVYDEYIETYSDVIICTTWNRWRVARLRVLAIIVRLASLSLPSAALSRSSPNIMSSASPSSAPPSVSSSSSPSSALSSPLPSSVSSSPSPPPSSSSSPSPDPSRSPSATSNTNNSRETPRGGARHPEGLQHKIQATIAIQDMADDICACVPFIMGNRMKPAPLHSTNASYPPSYFTGAPASVEHHKSAAAWGGWLLVVPLKEAMNVGMWLRPGQLAWIGPQLMRVAIVYDVDPDSGMEEGERRWKQEAVWKWNSQSPKMGVEVNQQPASQPILETFRSSKEVDSTAATTPLNPATDLHTINGGMDGLSDGLENLEIKWREEVEEKWAAERLHEENGDDDNDNDNNGDNDDDDIVEEEIENVSSMGHESDNVQIKEESPAPEIDLDPQFNLDPQNWEYWDSEEWRTEFTM